jgi:hypothetical protein
MLEQILEGLKTDPSPHKIRAFLCLVDTLNEPDKKAEALAEFGRIRLRADTFEALKALQCGFRLSPRNKKLLETLDWIFATLNREEAHKRVVQYRHALQQEALANLEKTNTKAPIEFDGNVKTTMSAPLNTVIGTNPLERISLEFSLSEVTGTQSVPLSPQSPTEPELNFAENSFSISKIAPSSKHVASPSTETKLENTKLETSILVGEPSALVRFTFSENEGAFGVFAEYLRTTGIDFRLLEKAEGFQDSTLGLVLFVNYLLENEKIPKEKIGGAIEILKSFVFRKDSDVRSQVRFHELFEMSPSEK